MKLFKRRKKKKKVVKPTIPPGFSPSGIDWSHTTSAHPLMDSSFCPKCGYLNMVDYRTGKCWKCDA